MLSGTSESPLFRRAHLSHNTRLALPEPSRSGTRTLAQGGCSGALAGPGQRAPRPRSLLSPGAAGPRRLHGPSSQLQGPGAGSLCQQWQQEQGGARGTPSLPASWFRGQADNLWLLCWMPLCLDLLFMARLYWLWASGFCANLCRGACRLSELSSHSKTSLRLSTLQGLRGVRSQPESRQDRPATFSSGPGDHGETEPAERHGECLSVFGCPSVGVGQGRLGLFPHTPMHSG